MTKINNITFKKFKKTLIEQKNYRSKIKMIHNLSFQAMDFRFHLEQSKIYVHPKMMVPPVLSKNVNCKAIKYKNKTVSHLNTKMGFSNNTRIN